MSASASAVAGGRRPRLVAFLSPDRVHLLILALAFAASIVATTRLWFFYDDWAFLIPGDAPWTPHVGHWSTAPYLIFHGLRAVFGIDAFLPFAIPVIAAHLALVHLLWRLMKRIGVAPWLATTASALLAFLGAGAENILWAFQIGYIGAMALMTAVILLLLRERPRGTDVVLIVVLTLVAPSFSGTAIPLLAVAALIGWMRHGPGLTASLLGPGLAAYLVWFVLEGRFAPPVGRAEGLGDILSTVPAFGLKMLTEGFGRAFPVEILGPLFFSVVAIWGVLSWPRASREERPAYILFLAAPLFALLTAYSRVNLGLETATSSRYLYFIIPVMLPLMMLALQKATDAWRLPRGGVVALLVVLIVFNIGGLAGALATRAAIVADTRERLSAALVVLDEDDDGDIDGEARPYSYWVPEVGAADLQEMHRQGWFRGSAFGERAYLSTLVALETHAAPAGADSPDCVDGASSADLGGEFLVAADADASVLISLSRGDVTGDAAGFGVAAGTTVFDLDIAPGIRVHVEGDGIRICEAGS